LCSVAAIFLVVSIPILLVFAILLTITGRVAGAKNYKKEFLLSAVWRSFQLLHTHGNIASLFRDNYGETKLWEKDDVKRHWTKKCVTNSRSQQERLVLQMISSCTPRECSYDV
jgi:hypothetical protein